MMFTLEHVEVVGQSADGLVLTLALLWGEGEVEGDEEKDVGVAVPLVGDVENVDDVSSL